MYFLCVLSRVFLGPECFFNKDGMWYYAGVYKAFRLEDLTTKEWEALSSEVRSNFQNDRRG